MLARRRFLFLLGAVSGIVAVRKAAANTWHLAPRRHSARERC